MNKNHVDADALKPVLIKLLEDEDVLNSIRGALCRALGCAAPVVQGGYDGGQNDRQDGNAPCRDTENRLREAERELARSRQQVEQRDQDLSKLHDRVTQAEQKTRYVETERDKALNENAALQKRSVLPPELAGVLAHVRGDAELVKRLELNTALDDTAMLVQTVAVLSQESNLKRLWDFYKSRCEARRAELSPQDRTVFDAALGWLNANRPDRPHQISCPATGISYDYQKNIRPPGMIGETITAVWLPGVPSMGLLPVVATG